MIFASLLIHFCLQLLDFSFECLPLSSIYLTFFLFSYQSFLNSLQSNHFSLQFDYLSVSLSIFLSFFEQQLRALQLVLIEILTDPCNLLSDGIIHRLLIQQRIGLFFEILLNRFVVIEFALKQLIFWLHGTHFFELGLLGTQELSLAGEDLWTTSLALLNQGKSEFAYFCLQLTALLGKQISLPTDLQVLWDPFPKRDIFVFSNSCLTLTRLLLLDLFQLGLQLL